MEAGSGSEVQQALFFGQVILSMVMGGIFKAFLTQ